MRVLITGGAGFIGSNLVHWTLQHRPEAEITVLDALTYAGHLSSLADVRERIRFVHGRLEDAALVNELVGEMTGERDVVIHLAAESHNDRSITDPGPFVQTNVVGTFTLLEAIRQSGVRLHHVSTDEVFGDLPIDVGTDSQSDCGVEHSRDRASDRPAGFIETDRYRPSSPYAATKASSDHLVRAWARTYGIRATISSCSNNYGPLQHPEKSIPQQITRALTDRPAVVYGSGRNVRDWLHVDDHCDAIWTVIDSGCIGQTYGVSAGQQCSNLAVLDLLRQLLAERGVPLRIQHIGDRPGHDRRLAIDATRLRDELGWRPQHPDLESGLRATVAWYVEHAEWWRPLVL